MVAGVAGAPVAHSLSPAIHNAWIAKAGLDAVYVAFSPPAERFEAFARGLRGGVIRGLNITAPFKAAALGVADRASDRARRAGAANLLVFDPDGRIRADNTDGEGLLAAFAQQAPDFDPAAGPTVILGAGGAACGAAAALLSAGAPEIRIVSRSEDRGHALAEALGARARRMEWGDSAALAGAGAVINATPVAPDIALEGLADGAVAMDMVYRPVGTPFLRRSASRGLRTVDGLAMLIGQAAPSFEALFGRPPPGLDVRAVALATLGEA
ncbi:MAG: shikimate dehydrogenase [Caulobacteraceae bacterium]|nr:shikimate dehydrogenase [Caulobacteraceae bacterium]